ncbi:Hsp70 family protein (plasmid) [Rhodococcus pseudokoreensis]|uniref:Hsp70 family protein n=1 Tax=Rhodococcus pseudokoreensis TaxID=2811421 RepID=A0A974VYE3_9NOCA|nr:Hsp70 family protein [Rhodococcus pseudokoreensis]QSE87875.1 Hsp70 family protein [Rhodococcus pseudokoreensis]
MVDVVGIDLGTTYSAVAVMRPTGIPEVLLNSEGEDIMPSVVMFQEIDGKDEPLVGSMAKHAAASAPHEVVEFVKRSMGDAAWRFETSAGASLRAEEVSAVILRRLKADAELALGTPVTDAVITVPAYFDDARRRATKDAGEIAGLNVLRVLNEPTAAALSFGLDSSADGTVLVYDLGGGTFDVTVMRIGAGMFEVLATDGDRNLGGFDFDNRLMVHLAEQIQDQGGPDVLEDEMQTAALREKAEMAKRSLTTVASTMVVVSDSGRSYRVQIDRSSFETLTSDLLRRTADLTESVLEEAELGWAAIDHVLLVGGSTRMPMVRQLVEKLSGRTPDKSVHPDQAVALGAAIQAAVEASVQMGQELDVYDGKPLEVLDVTSQALGTLSLDGTGGKTVNNILIPRNTKIPAKHAEDFFTASEQQTAVRVEVTQGDDIDPEYVVVIGEKVLPIPPYPKGAPIRISYAYDIDQTVFVEVTDLTTNTLLGTFDIDRIANMSDDDVATAKDRISRLTVS